MMDFDTQDTYRECIRKAISWLSRQQAADGSLGADPNTFYKIPWVMAISGRQDRAVWLVDWIKRNELDESWHFASRYSRKDRFPWPTKNTGGEATMAYLYAHVQVGAHLVGRFDVSGGLLDTVLSYQDPSHGGFYGKRVGSNQWEMDLMTTGFCGLACLYNGRIGEATRAARFLVTMKDAQPDLSEGVYVCMRNDGTLITDFAEEDAPCYILRRGAEKQMYIFLGAAVMGLCETYAAIPDPDFLEAAKRYYEWAMNWDDIWATPRAGKLARGASGLYKATQDPEYAKTAIRIADYIATTQNEDGSWPAPPGNRESWTAEFTIHLTEILKNVVAPR